MQRVTLHEADRIFYLHIPKTAGLAFTKVLKEQSAIPENQQAIQLHVSDFLQHPPEYWQQFRLLTGHVFYFPTRYLPFQPHYVTLLRDPIERTISSYAYIKSTGPWLPYYNDVKDQTLHEFVTNPKTAPLSANLQARYLLFDFDLTGLGDDINQPTYNQYKQHFQRMIDTIPLSHLNLSEDEALALAKQRLDKLAFVGIQEMFDLSAALLCHTFHWPLIRKAEAVNVSPNRPKQESIAPETLTVIRDLTALDTALYEYGKIRFEAYLLRAFNQLHDEAGQLAPTRQQAQRLRDESAHLQQQLHQTQGTLNKMQSTRSWRLIERWWQFKKRISGM